MERIKKKFYLFSITIILKDKTVTRKVLWEPER